MTSAAPPASPAKSRLHPHTSLEKRQKVCGWGSISDHRGNTSRVTQVGAAERKIGADWLPAAVACSHRVGGKEKENSALRLSTTLQRIKTHSQIA